MHLTTCVTEVNGSVKYVCIVAIVKINSMNYSVGGVSSMYGEQELELNFILLLLLHNCAL